MSVKAISRLGDWMVEQKIRLINRTGAAVLRGEVVALDLTGSDGDVDTWTAFLADTSPDQAASPLANAIDPATAHLTGWIFGCCLETSIADNSAGMFMLCGVCGISMTAAAVVAGDKLMPANAVNTVLKGTDGNVHIALALEPNGSAAGVFDCIFDGWCLQAAGAAS